MIHMYFSEREKGRKKGESSFSKYITEWRTKNKNEELKQIVIFYSKII